MKLPDSILNLALSDGSLVKDRLAGAMPLVVEVDIEAYRGFWDLRRLDATRLGDADGVVQAEAVLQFVDAHRDHEFVGLAGEDFTVLATRDFRFAHTPS